MNKTIVDKARNSLLTSKKLMFTIGRMRKLDFLPFLSIASLLLFSFLVGNLVVKKIAFSGDVYAIDGENGGENGGQCGEDQLLLEDVCYDPNYDDETFEWCHCGTNHCNTIHVPLSALQHESGEGGHVDAQGNLLHNDDHLGQCTTEEIDVCANIEGQQTEVPGGYELTDEENGICELIEEENGDSTPTPSTDVCDNIDGIQTSVPEGLHLDASGLNCVAFQLGGPPPPPPAQPQPQVLGATTMAQTGTAEENIFLALFALGSILAGTGVRKLAASKR